MNISFALTPTPFTVRERVISVCEEKPGRKNYFQCGEEMFDFY